MQRQSSYLLPAYYDKNLQLRENKLVNNSIHFLDLKIIINEKNNLTFDLYSNHND